METASNFNKIHSDRDSATGDGFPNLMEKYGLRLVDQGHHIVACIPGAKIPGNFQNGRWTPDFDWGRYAERFPSDLEFDYWVNRWPGTGVSLLLKDKFVIDCDIKENPELAEEIREECKKEFGDTVTKVGEAPKWSMIYRTNEPIKKIALHPMEGLGYGNQTVIYNIHPGTGLPYMYPFGDEMVEVHHTDLPEITEERARRFLQRMFDQIPADLRQRRLGEDRSSNTYYSRGGNLRGSFDAMEDALRYIPNNSLHYDDWIRIGMALKGAVGDEGFRLFDEWSRQSTKYNKKTSTMKTWKSLDPHSVGAGTIIHYALQFGWSPPDDLYFNEEKKAAAERKLSPEFFDKLRENEEQRKARKQAEKAAAKAVNEAAEAEAKENSLRLAKRLAGEARPVEGTLAELFLTKHAGLSLGPGSWPETVKFHPVEQALVIIATTMDGDVQAVRLVFLDDEGAACERMVVDRQGVSVTTSSQDHGDTEGAVARLPGDDDAVLVAEGIENGLAVWSSTGRATHLSLSSMTKYQPTFGSRILLCRQDIQQRNEPLTKGIRRSIQKWRAVGIDVLSAFPWASRRYDESTFHTLLREEGGQAVQDRIDAILTPFRHENHPIHHIPIDQARQAAAAVTKAFVDEVKALDAFHRQRVAAIDETAAKEMAALQADRLAGNVDDAAFRERKTGIETRQAEMTQAESDVYDERRRELVHGVKIDLGVGKTHAATHAVAEYLVELRAAGDKRSVVYAIPRHELGEEIVKNHLQPLLDRYGLKARVWRGRAAPDPHNPGQSMCLNLEAVEAVEKAFGKAGTDVCKRGRHVCQFFEACSYQRQAAASADVMVMPHESLFHVKPAAAGDVALVVVDESAWSKGLKGIQGRPIELTMEELSQKIELPQKPMIEIVDINRAQRLQYLNGLLVDVVNDHEDGPIRREAMLEKGFTREACLEAAKGAYMRKIDVEGLVVPGMPASDVKKALEKAAKHNRVIMRTADAFVALAALLADDGPDASGWVYAATEKDENGEESQVLHLRGRRSVKKGFAAPTLLIDAFLDPELVRPYWPGIRQTADIRAETPSAKHYQLADSDMPKSHLIPVIPKDEDGQPIPMPGPEYNEAMRRLENSRLLKATIQAMARGSEGQVVAIPYKAVEDHWLRVEMTDGTFRDLPQPVHLDVGHHNGVSGKDCWRDVRKLVVIGRTEPAPGEVEKMMEALTGQAVIHVDGYDQIEVAFPGPHGTQEKGLIVSHPDPMAERVRWQIVEGGAMQAIGRARAVGRTAENPVDIFIMNRRILPIEIDGVFHLADVETPTMEQQMLAEEALALTNHADIATCFPSLWATKEAAKQEAYRERQMVTAPNKKEFIIGSCYHLAFATYRVDVPRRGKAKLVFDPDLLDEAGLRVWLEERLGKLAMLEIDPARRRRSPTG